MDGYHPPPRKPLPSAIHELQRILHEASDARLAAIERMRKIFLQDDDPSAPSETAGQPRDGFDLADSLDPETALVKFVRESIDRDGVSFVFSDRLGDVWPVATDAEIRYRGFAIREFASRHGWDVYLMNEGQIAMFRGANTRTQ